MVGGGAVVTVESRYGTSPLVVLVGDGVVERSDSLIGRIPFGLVVGAVVVSPEFRTFYLVQSHDENILLHLF